MSQEVYEVKPPGKPLLNILKHIWSRVYLNIYDGGDFTEESELVLKAALMEFFLPTTKRKLQRKIPNTNEIDWWSHWLGAGSSELGIRKAAFIILLDIALFFPRLAINVAKFFTEALPDTIAQLFLWAHKKAKEEYNKTNGLPAFGYGLGWAVTGLFAALFKCVYFLGCCITSPIATSIRARNFFDNNNPLSNIISFLSSHFLAPAVSYVCYLGVYTLLANLILPGVGFLALLLGGVTLALFLGAYIAIDHVLSGFNRNPNGDELFELYTSNEGADQFRYSDRDISKKLTKNTEPLTKAYEKVEQEIKSTLTYKPFFSSNKKPDENNNISEQDGPLISVYD